MDELNSYFKKNTALELVESEGYTKDFPEASESRIISQDFLLDSKPADALRNVYGRLF